MRRDTFTRVTMLRDARFAEFMKKTELEVMENRTNFLFIQKTSKHECLLQINVYYKLKKVAKKKEFA